MWFGWWQCLKDNAVYRVVKNLPVNLDSIQGGLDSLGVKTCPITRKKQ
jgi:hypothetical protein